MVKKKRVQVAFSETQWEIISELRNVEIQNDRLRFRKNLERIGEIFAYEISKELEYEKKDQRPALKFEDVQNLDLVDVEGEVEQTAPAFMLMDGVRNALVTSCRPYGKMNFFIDAKNSSKIAIMNNDFTKINEFIKSGEGMTDEDIFMSSNMR